MTKGLASLLLVNVLALAGCGSDPIEDYCSAIKEHRKELNELADADTQYGLITHLPMLKKLSHAAPEDLADEWQTFISAVGGLNRAVQRSGHSASDFDNGAMPSNVSAGDKAAIKAAADELSAQAVVAAAQGIDQQARDVCKVNLGR